MSDSENPELDSENPELDSENPELDNETRETDDEIHFTDANKSVYCGKKKKVPFGYSKRGSPHECFRSGIGDGMVKNIPEFRRDETSYDVRVLTNLEILRLANRLGIRTVKKSEGRTKKPRDRKRLLKDILKRLNKMNDYVSSK